MAETKTIRKWFWVWEYEKERQSRRMCWLQSGKRLVENFTAGVLRACEKLRDSCLFARTMSHHMLACFGECRDNARNWQSVFLIV